MTTQTSAQNSTAVQYEIGINISRKDLNGRELSECTLFRTNNGSVVYNRVSGMTFWRGSAVAANGNMLPISRIEADGSRTELDKASAWAEIAGTDEEGYLHQLALQFDLDVDAETMRHIFADTSVKSLRVRFSDTNDLTLEVTPSAFSAGNGFMGKARIQNATIEFSQAVIVDTTKSLRPNLFNNVRQADSYVDVKAAMARCVASRAKVTQVAAAKDGLTNSQAFFAPSAPVVPATPKVVEVEKVVEKLVEVTVEDPAVLQQNAQLKAENAELVKQNSFLSSKLDNLSIQMERSTTASNQKVAELSAMVEKLLAAQTQQVVVNPTPAPIVETPVVETVEELVEEVVEEVTSVASLEDLADDEPLADDAAADLAAYEASCQQNIEEEEDYGVFFDDVELGMDEEGYNEGSEVFGTSSNDSDDLMI